MNKKGFLIQIAYIFLHISLSLQYWSSNRKETRPQRPRIQCEIVSMKYHNAHSNSDFQIALIFVDIKANRLKNNF